MNPIAILNAFVMVGQGIETLSVVMAALKKALSGEIPDEEMDMETQEDLIARLKASGQIPQDWQPPVLEK